MGGDFLLFSRDGKTPYAALGVLLTFRRLYLLGFFFLSRGFGEGGFNPLGDGFPGDGNLFGWSRG
jgi:hypothetical protein